MLTSETLLLDFIRQSSQFRSANPLMAGSC